MNEDRLNKLKQLSSVGINPYPANFLNKLSTAEVKKLESDTKFRDVNDIKKGFKNTIRVAGRLMTFRAHGALSFGQLQDFDGRIQVAFVRGFTAVADLKTEKMTAEEFWKKMLDLGDYIGVEGELFLTNHGEITIFAKNITFLGKALHSMPEKFHGLANEEQILRQRYLDTLTNENSRKRFKMRSDIIRAVRRFMWDNRFDEVETPSLEHSATGAAAKPYFTHNNALDLDLVLRISQELPLKKIILGGFERVFEIGKAFRNEGIDPSHLPEHTHFEWYAAYWSFRENMKFTEDLIKAVISEVGLNPVIPIKNKEGKIVEVDFAKKWEQVDFIKLVKKDSGIDIEKISDADELRSKIREKNIEIPDIENMGYATMVDYLYKKVSRPKIIGPTFLYNYPLALQPLARKSDENTEIAEQFQLVVNGWEIVKGYSELVDPIDQAKRFHEQKGVAEKGDEEAMQGDDNYILAMEHGMPPISGVGLGLDRFVTLLTQQDNLRDCVFFPLMRPEGKKLKSETSLAVVLLNNSLKLKPWEYANTIAHLNAAFGARTGKNLFEQDIITTKDKQNIKLNIQHAILIKEAQDNVDIKDIITKSREKNLEVAEFTREMINTTDDKRIVEITKNKNFADIEYLGVLIFGKKSEVEGLTKKFKLFQ